MTHSVRSAPASLVHSGLPKPTEKRNTFTPHHRATRKWPSSWITMREPRATRNAITVVARLMDSCGPGTGNLPQRPGRLRYPGIDQPALRALAGKMIGGEHVAERRHGTRAQRRHDVLDQRGDLPEAQRAGKKLGHRDFVGSVQRRGCGPCRPQRGV